MLSSREPGFGRIADSVPVKVSEGPDEILESSRELLARLGRRTDPEEVRKAVARFLAPDLETSKVDQQGADPAWSIAWIEAEPLDADGLPEGHWLSALGGKSGAPKRHAELSKAVEVSVFADGALRGEFPWPPGVSTRELRELVRVGEAAMETLVTSNLRLVLYWARRSVGQTLEDRFQDGALGLIRAVWGWDARRGYQFSTYATWHIRQSIQRSSHNNASAVRVPVHVLESLQSEGAFAAGRVNADTAYDPYSTSSRDAGLRALLPFEDITQIGESDWARDDRAARAAEIDDMLDRLDAERCFRQISRVLDDREKLIIRRRYSVPRATLEEIGDELGVTRERVRQLETKALLRLTAAAAVSGFIDTAGLEITAEIRSWVKRGLPTGRARGAAALQLEKLGKGLVRAR